MTTRAESFDDPLNPNRSFSLVTADHWSDVTNGLPLTANAFVCLLAWDATERTHEEVYKVAECVLHAGARFICTWGTDCERVHDLIDDAVIGQEGGDIDPIWTTWHDDETLEETIDFVLTTISPAERFTAAEQNVVAVTIASRQYSETIRNTFRSG
ncbi:MAG: hypothetical protein AAF517_10640 [Planctomycetota bacterium]